VKYHRTPLSVRFYEVDRYAAVWHGWYVGWCEMGRVDICAAYGMTNEMLHENGCLLPVADLELHYKQSARLDDDLVILTAPDPEESPESPIVTFHYRIERDGELLASARTRQCMMSPEGKVLFHPPTPVAEALRRMRLEQR